MARRRLLLSSANLIVTIVLLGVLFIMVNFVASRRYARWDLTRQKITALSDRTRQVVKSLTEPVSVIVFYQPDHRLYTLVNDLLEEYGRLTDRIRIERVDPQQDVARARQLVKEFDIDVTNPEALNLDILKSGLPAAQIAASRDTAQAGNRHKYLSDNDLAEYDYEATGMGGEPRVKSFKGEDAFTSALISITQAQTPLVWFTTGHGEKSIESGEQAGLSDLKKHLEQQNLSIQPVTLLEHTEIAPEVKLIVIAGPTRRFTENEVQQLQAYLDKGGRLFALLDPLDDTGLDGLLERWGIRLDQDIVVDPARQLPFVSAANLFITSYTQHPIVEKMKMLMTLFPLARSIRATDQVPQGVLVTPLALTSESGWGETQTDVETFKFDQEKDLKGPISIAVAAERSGTPPTRLVVVGDSDFIINAQLGNVGNRDLLLGAVYWLMQQEQLIGIGPKTLESIRLNLTARQLNGLFWFSFFSVPLAFILLGVAMWWLRRQ